MLDPVLRSQNVHVEPEELIDPALEMGDNSTRIKRLKYRLSTYGNRVLESGKQLITSFTETIANIATALAGSIILLPVVIIVRGVSVLMNNFFGMFKPFILSLFRVLLDVLRGLIWPLREAFTHFNKDVLFPLMKRIKEDDTAALVAFGVLVLLIGGVVFAATRLF